MAVAGAFIVVHRARKVTRQDIFRAYSIEVDGVPRGKLARGDSLRVEVAPGPHVVRAAIDWAGSPEIGVQVEPGQEIQLEVTGVGGPRAALSADAATAYLRIAPVTAAPDPGR